MSEKHGRQVVFSLLLASTQ